MKRLRFTLALALALLPAAACRVGLPSDPALSFGGAEKSLGAWACSEGLAYDRGYWFAPDLFLDGSTLETSREPRGLRAEIADDGCFRTLVCTDPPFEVTIEGAPGERRLFAAFGKRDDPMATPAAISPEGEDVKSFAAALREGALGLVWCASARGSDSVRAALVTTAKAISARVPYVSELRVNASPTIAAIGPAAEASFVIAYEASAKAGGPRSVRVARAARRPDGTLSVSADRAPALSLFDSRAPRLAARRAEGLLAFEGTPRGTDSESGLYVVSITEQGDALGRPVLFAAVREGEIVRSHPAALDLGGSWYLAWEEMRGSAPTEVKLRKLELR